MKTYHVVRGQVTCPDVAAIFGVNLGDPEFQFSDGPPGSRSCSFDYPSIEAGVADLSPAIFVFEKE